MAVLLQVFSYCKLISCVKHLCSGAPYRLDPCCSHLSGLHGVWRELPSQPQYWHAAQVNSSDNIRMGDYVCFEFNFELLCCCFCFLLHNSFVCHVFVSRCYEMERRLKTPDLFKFPYFEAICWYVAKNLLETLKGGFSFIGTNYR